MAKAKSTRVSNGESVEPEQASLWPERRPEVLQRTLSLDDLPPDSELSGEEPDADLIRNIRANGVLVPIEVRVLTEEGSGLRRMVSVVDGVRRIKALRRIVAKPGRGNDVTDLRRVPCVLTRVSENIGLGLTLALHATRRPNPIRDLETIEKLLERGFKEPQISAQTGFTIAKIKARMRLQALIPYFREELREGKIPAGLAERIARLPDAKQIELREHGPEKLTGALVRDMRSAGREKAAQEMLDGLPPEGPIGPPSLHHDSLPAFRLYSATSEAPQFSSRQEEYEAEQVFAAGWNAGHKAKARNAFLDEIIGDMFAAGADDWVGPIYESTGVEFDVIVRRRDRVPPLDLCQRRDTRVPGDAAEFLSMVADALIHRLGSQADLGWISDRPVAQFDNGALAYRIEAFEISSRFEVLGKRDRVPVVKIHARDEDWVDPAILETIAAESQRARVDEYIAEGTATPAMLADPDDSFEAHGHDYASPSVEAKATPAQALPALHVICPEPDCQAQPGVPCHNKRGIDRVTHPRRVRAAERQRKADAEVATPT